MLVLGGTADLYKRVLYQFRSVVQPDIKIHNEVELHVGIVHIFHEL